LLTGRPKKHLLCQQTRQFQSAPRDCSRGDFFNLMVRREKGGFNPRPAIAHGATKQAEILVEIMSGFNPRPAIAHGATKAFSFNSSGSTGFNPRPAIAHGATSCHRPNCYLSPVSIRAPRLLTGRLTATVKGAVITEFQSAPRDCSRGDRGPWLLQQNGSVSIRAPRLLTGRRTLKATIRVVMTVSIRAPRLLTGRRPGH